MGHVSIRTAKTLLELATEAGYGDQCVLMVNFASQLSLSHTHTLPIGLIYP